MFSSRKDFQIKHNGHRIELEKLMLQSMLLMVLSELICIYDEKKQFIIGFMKVNRIKGNNSYTFSKAAKVYAPSRICKS